jgi:hypothetical protein
VKNSEEFFVLKVRWLGQSLSFGLGFFPFLFLLLESLDQIDSLDTNDSGSVELDVNFSFELFVFWLELVNLAVD